MGSIVILVIIVVWWLLSIQKKNKRNAAKRMSQQATMDDCESAESSENADSDSLHQCAAHTDEADAYYTSSWQSTMDDSSNVEADNVQKNRKKQEEANDNSTPENNIVEELNLSDADNARKAFIASELLKRKY